MDLFKMMKNAKNLQENMQKLQAEIEAIRVSGEAGGGMVKVVLNGKGELTGLDIDPDFLRNSDKTMLEDLIISAHSLARLEMERQVAQKGQSAIGQLSAG